MTNNKKDKYSKADDYDIFGRGTPRKSIKKKVSKKEIELRKKQKALEIKKVKKRKRKTKIKLISTLLIFIIIIAIGAFIYINLTGASQVLRKYYKLLSMKNYEEMYNIVETDMSKEDFVSRLKNIYEGISASNINLTISANTKSKVNENEINIKYNVTMDTSAGSLKFVDNALVIHNNGEYKIKWDSSMIYPDLQDTYKVIASTIPASRGTLYDRNGTALAKDGTIYSVGLVPGKMDDTTDLKRLSELLEISEESINKNLNASYVTKGTFVPLKKISKEKQDLKNDLLKIKGVMISDVSARVYPYKQVTSIMTGYVQDREGKSGLEYAYNSRLRGTDGAEIYIVDADGNKVKSLVKTEAQDGEDIKLTIDVDLQNKIYKQFEDDESSVVALNYNTGEILALVSTPSYDSNNFSVGFTETEWKELQDDEKKPMYNRYLASYAPGSSLKPVVAAIGLENNTITAEEEFEKSGKKWQLDESWKDLYVTTLETYQGPANLQNALVYSDNIYFAKLATKMGKELLKQGFDKLGFSEKIPFIQDTTISSYGSLSSSAAIANTGYGQAEVLVNPIHMASIYSSFANGGSMVKPYIELDKNEETQTKLYKENIISNETANTIKSDLIEVVNNGTAQEAKIEGKVIAGKTGTAEIKQTQDDKDGTEIGWFDAFDDSGTLIISMCENTKSKSGSHYVVKKVKNILE